MGKLFSRGHFEIFTFFFLVTKFDISWRKSAWKVKFYFLEKIRKLSLICQHMVVKVELRYTNISSEIWLWSLLWMTQPANVHCAHLPYQHCPWRNHLSKSLADVWKGNSWWVQLYHLALYITINSLPPWDSQSVSMNVSYHKEQQYIWFRGGVLKGFWDIKSFIGPPVSFIERILS